ncbi:hypothetical protein [Janthinobacterium lividum]|uniref:hypothetical protein n=1 Tax=Janthinobacterium lividum TaxID=29581 RepID=UPI001E366BCF|nr:hypothetical protein [Janthinobacterium lividum]WQE31799.1 hypothetical protein U0004_29755 [Janthinobacterium lividum]
MLEHVSAATTSIYVRAKEKRTAKEAANYFQLQQNKNDPRSRQGLQISRATAAKWLKRNDVQDRSHWAHTLHTTLDARPKRAVLLR